jgi:CBS domain-containing protein
LSAGIAAPPEITRFLREHPPFDSFELSEVERVAATVEVEFHRAGAVIFLEDTDPVEHLRVIRSGAVQIVHQGRVLDLLGPGELFGHASMLSGLPTGFEARAAEDTLCYRIGAEVARELLAAPAGVRFVTRSLLEAWGEGVASADREAAPDPAEQPVGTLLRGKGVVCTPDTSIREAARLMSDAPATSVLVEVGDGSLGIVTDHDLRNRVIAAGLDGGEPVTKVMTAPAYTCTSDELGGQVLLEMLDRGFRHFPVLSATGEILGVIEDRDIAAARTRSSYALRQRIARATSVEELSVVAREFRPGVIAMHDARVAAINVMAVYSVVVDALTRRLLDLAVEEAGATGLEFAWMALGSQARREATPASDVDCAIVWFGDVDEREIRPLLHGIGTTVMAGLEACGLRPDQQGATASNVVFVRSLASWQRAIRSLISDPTQEKALILSSVLVDSRPVWGVHTGTPVSDMFRLAPSNPHMLRMLARFSLSYRPPTGFFRGLVVEHGGEHRGRLDLKHGGMIPIVDLARWAGISAGVTNASTVERLRAGGSAGVIATADAHTLIDAFELISALRVQHQVQQLRAGAEPDDYVDPASLSRLTRTYLKEAFRAVASIQKQLSAEVSLLTS